MENLSTISCLTFTILLDFKCGTYISQVIAESPKAALICWCKGLETETISGFRKKKKRQIIEKAISEDVVSLHDVTNVWCAAFSLGKDFALVNIVKTDIE
jgi:hypothetical protein